MTASNCLFCNANVESTKTGSCPQCGGAMKVARRESVARLGNITGYGSPSGMGPGVYQALLDQAWVEHEEALQQQVIPAEYAPYIVRAPGATAPLRISKKRSLFQRLFGWLEPEGIK